jgi:hypothetical protein
MDAYRKNKGPKGEIGKYGRRVARAAEMAPSPGRHIGSQALIISGRDVDDDL